MRKFYLSLSLILGCIFACFVSCSDVQADLLIVPTDISTGPVTNTYTVGGDAFDMTLSFIGGTTEGTIDMIGGGLFDPVTYRMFSLDVTNVTPVPDPRTAKFLLGCLMGLMAMRWRKL
jgi:hypothetical protein